MMGGSYHQMLFVSSLLLVLQYHSLRIECSRFDPTKVKPLGQPHHRLLNVTELAELHGYSGRRYDVRTEDGYILGLTRIGNSSGPPVLFINGMALGPELWVLHGSGHDLALVMSDLGYDVWIGGQRGVRGSLGHTSLDYSKQPEYWDFSHDESGKYDIPAMIDLITSETGHDQIFYVGISLGGTIFMAMCNLRPEYCAKVRGNVQFAPALVIPQWQDIPQRVKINLDLMKLVTFAKRERADNEMLAARSFLEGMRAVCENKIMENVCFWCLNEITGFQKKNMAQGWLGVSLAHSASGTSVRQIEHLLQLTANGGLKMYDFGLLRNKEIYGTHKPPSYNLSQFTSPTVVIYSERDILIPKKAMMEAVKSIENLNYARPVADKSYGHSEFVFGKDLYKLVFNDVIDFFDSLSGL